VQCDIVDLSVVKLIVFLHRLTGLWFLFLITYCIFALLFIKILT